MKITLNFSDLSASSTRVQVESVTPTSLTCASTASRTASRTFSGSKAFWLFPTESLREQFKSVQELEKGNKYNTKVPNFLKDPVHQLKERKSRQRTTPFPRTLYQTLYERKSRQLTTPFPRTLYQTLYHSPVFAHHQWLFPSTS